MYQYIFCSKLKGHVTAAMKSFKPNMDAVRIKKFEDFQKENIKAWMVRRQHIYIHSWFKKKQCVAWDEKIHILITELIIKKNCNCTPSIYSSNIKYLHWLILNSSAATTKFFHCKFGFWVLFCFIKKNEMCRYPLISWNYVAVIFIF